MTELKDKPPDILLPTGLDDAGLIIDLAPVGLCSAKDRVITRCNQMMSVMFGFAKKEMEGRSFEPFYTSIQSFERIGRRGYDAMENCGIYGDERVMRRRNGDQFWCRVSGRTLDSNQPFAHTVWIFEDISARRPIEPKFTPREVEIIDLLARGLSAKRIARHLQLSPRTIEGHRARLIKKTGVRTAGELIARASAMVF